MMKDESNTFGEDALLILSTDSAYYNILLTIDH